MKINSKLVWFVISMMMVSLPVGAATVWTGSSSDNWSDSLNWTAGVPGSPETIIAVNAVDTEGVLTLDLASSGVQKLLFYATVATNFTFSGSTLTLDPGQINPIANAATYIPTFNNDVVIDTTGSVRRPSIGPGLTFNGALTQTGDGDFEFVGSGTVEFNGKVTTEKTMELTTSGATYRFGNTVSNEISGLTLADTGCELIVNTAAGINFFDGAVIQVNKNAELTFNNANVIGDSTRITLGAVVTACTATFNADETLGVVVMAGSVATLTLDLGSNVNHLAFANTSAATWGAGSGVVITNFRPDVISFGANGNGLSSAQMDVITAYDSTGALVADLEIDASGFLTVPEAVTYTEWTGATDGSWTTAGNWTEGVPGSDAVSDEVRFGANTANADNIVISAGASNPNAILALNTMAADYVINGETLTIDDNGDGSDAFNNSSSGGYSVTWNNDLVINGAGERRISSIGASAGAAQVFNGTVTSTATKLTVRNALVYFNDALSLATLQVDGDTQVVVSNTTANAISAFSFANSGGTPAEVIVNTPAGTNFYDGAKIQMNYNGKITFNSANVLGDSTHLTIGSGSTLDATFNADESLGRIFIPQDNGALNLTLGDDVNELAFLAMNTVIWSNGASVVVSNFMPDVIRFGASDAALTAEQLAVMTAYDWSGAVVTNLDINSSGYLVGDITLNNPYVPPEVGTIWIDVVSADEVAISWISSNAANYAVETTTDLTSDSWGNVATNIVGIGGSMSVTDSVDQVNFYRVYSY